MKRSHSLRIATLTSSLVLALAACSGGGPQGATSAAGPGGKAAKGGTVRVLTNVAFSHLDPARGFDGGVNNFYRLIYRTLTTQGAAPGRAGTAIRPDLATDTGRPSQGGKTWTFTLKKGLRFQNGDPITSAEVKFGVSRAWDPEIGIGSPYARQLIDAPDGYKGPYASGDLRTIETPDPRTIVFHLKRPYADFGSVVAQPTFTPFPKGTGGKGEFDREPIASGPYQVASYKRGASLTLDRNEHWDPGTDTVRKALPDHFAWTFGLDGATIDERMIANQGDDASAIAGGSGIQPATVARIQTPAVRGRTLSGLTGCTTYLGLNTTKAPLDQVKVRQAIAYAVNKATQVDAVGGTAKAQQATSIQPPTVVGRKSYDPYPSEGGKGDLAAARRLLGEAGARDGFALTLDIRSQPYMQQQGVAIQQALAPLKIKVKLNTIDTATYYEAIGTPSHQHDAAITGWCPDWPSGATFLPPLFDGRHISAKGNQNLAQLEDKAVNNRIDAIAAMKDVDRQNAAYGELDEQIMKLAPVVPLMYDKYVGVVGGNIAGAYLHAGFSGGIDLVSVGLADPDKS